MLVLALLTSWLLFPGFTIAGGVTTECTSPIDWSWSFNSLEQSPCTVAEYLISTCDEDWYNTTDPPTTEFKSCSCTTVMYSLTSACEGCMSDDWPTWTSYTSGCTTMPPVSWFPNPVPDQTRLPQWALNDVTLEDKWNATNACAIGDLPELSPGQSIDSRGIDTNASTRTGYYPPYTPTSPPDTDTYSKKVSPGVIAGSAVAGVAFITIAGVVVFFFWRRSRVRGRGPPESSTVNDYSQALYRGTIVSGASQAPSVRSPVDGESSMSHTGSGYGRMGGMQALSIVSEINTTSQEPLAFPSSASPVRGAPQPHMVEDPQPLSNYVTIPPSLRAGSSSPTQMTINTPNFTMSYPESRGAPSVPSVPSQLPTSLYPASVSALTNTQASHQGEYRGPPIV